MHSFDLAFDNLFVPDANLIGGEGGLGKGFYLTVAVMMGVRMKTAGRALGVMRAALKAVIRYAKDRKVFKAPMIDYQLTRTKIASMAARFAACFFFSSRRRHTSSLRDWSSDVCSSDLRRARRRRGSSRPCSGRPSPGSMGARRARG